MNRFRVAIRKMTAHLLRLHLSDQVGAGKDVVTVMFRRRRSQQPGYWGVPGWHPPPQPADQVYYSSREHHGESPYKIGDRLPPTWYSHWPSWDRPVLVPGGCVDCDGRGYLLLADRVDDGTIRLHENECWQCAGTGRPGEMERRKAEEQAKERQRWYEEYRRRDEWAQQRGYRDYRDYEDMLRRQSAAQFPQNCKKCGGNGQVLDVRHSVNPHIPAVIKRCPRCGGSGIAR
jgi:hypothetical protein